MELFNQVKERHNLDLTQNTISIYGEWAGKGIQKSVAISNLDKSMFIFGVKITPHPKDEDDKTPAYWVDSSYLRNNECKIYNIDDYETYEIEIDFNYPQLAQNKIIDMTIAVEDECPVGKAFGHVGIGEGIVLYSPTWMLMVKCIVLRARARNTQRLLKLQHLSQLMTLKSTASLKRLIRLH